MENLLAAAGKPVIVGSGLAGLTVALMLAPLPVTLLCAGRLGHAGSSRLAQGGLAAALGPDDSAALHHADTLAAGAGLSDPAVAHLVTQDGSGIVAWLVKRGVRFDCDDHGALRLGMEAAHGKRRIVHAQGDGTGRMIVEALAAELRATPSVTVIEHAVVTDLLTADGRITGVLFETAGKSASIATDRVVLATGGAGGLWQHTTNPLSSWGSGLALAARAGAALADLEFMQFHPTAIDAGSDPMPLASEALRGEGAILIDETGERFMAGLGRAELEPRDVVTRAIWAHLGRGHKVFLDARQAIGRHFAARFPGIHALCQKAGIDPAREAIPVRPAAHYHMGGVASDLCGRSSVDGLWVAGEVAATGLHGANRLASNSLLEAVSFGWRVAEDIAAAAAPGNCFDLFDMDKPHAPAAHSTPAAYSAIVRATMSTHVGVLRDRAGLEAACRTLRPLIAQSDMALAGFMIATAALARTESRGGHARTDYPQASKNWQRRQVLRLADMLPEAEPDFARSVA